MKRHFLKILSTYPKLYFAFYSLRYRLEIFLAKQIIIITTPGHVGSSTTFHTIKKGSWGKGTRIYDIHSLEERFNNSSPVRSVSARHVLQEVLRSQLQKHRLKDKKIVLITLVRDPIARALGGKFQNPAVFLQELDSVTLSKEQFPEGCARVKKEMVQSGFLEDNFRWQMSFYQQEFKVFWEIDMFKQPLKREPGFLWFKNKNTELLVFALEYLNDLLPIKMNEHFNFEIKMSNVNTSEQRTRGDHDFYIYCKNNLKFEKKLVDSCYDNSILKQIYPKVLLQRFKQKWSAPPNKAHLS